MALYKIDAIPIKTRYWVKTPTDQEFAEFQRYYPSVGDLFLITMKHAVSARRAIYQMASYFRREFGFDFVQYSQLLNEDDKFCKAYIWTSHYGEDLVFGACCFRWREYPDTARKTWALQWIWLHPYIRSKGHLTEAWPEFKRIFGEFDVEWPYSKSMRQFLLKHEPTRFSFLNKFP